MKKIRTRFAPSPTGYLHIGGLRTALYSYAFAKSQNGDFILRIEDTDQDRIVPGSTEKIYEMLKIFGLNWDEGPLVGGPHTPYIQSERAKSGLYEKYTQKLLEKGFAYYCFCSPKSKEEIQEDHQGKKLVFRDPCRNLSPKEVQEKLASGEKPGIRLKLPDNQTISFYDFILKKEISWNTSFVDEVMLLKSDGFPTYHLAVVVDDYLMKITHVIRGRDWLPSTPVHLILYQYLNFPLPQIGHLTDILDPQGGKLSKRKGSVACEEFLAAGYLPEAILNFVMLLGWSPKNDREIFSLPEFIDYFLKGELLISNPIFNRQKLDWFNGYYIRQKTDQELFVLLKKYLSEKPSVFYQPSPKNDQVLAKSIPLIKERITKLSDYDTLAGFLFIPPDKIDPSLYGNLPYKDHLAKAVEVLANLKEWRNEKIQEALGELIQKEGWKTGDFYMSFRIALSGSRFTPPITNCAEILGQNTLARLQKALS